MHVQKVVIVVGGGEKKNVCEMLIRHECCGVGAPGSGGGTPCATSQREMEALLSCKSRNLCARAENTGGKS